MNQDYNNKEITLFEIGDTFIVPASFSLSSRLTIKKGQILNVLDKKRYGYPFNVTYYWFDNIKAWINESALVKYLGMTINHSKFFKFEINEKVNCTNLDELTDFSFHEGEELIIKSRKKGYFGKIYFFKNKERGLYEKQLSKIR